mmetsp:Transcript_53236/g.119496  ORF Transcript_53236/g.119496 Transcript_53236/m.119496 type:complete len:98 (-) Transcript_53236:132-425(-)
MLSHGGNPQLQQAVLTLAAEVLSGTSTELKLTILGSGSRRANDLADEIGKPSAAQAKNRKSLTDLATKIHTAASVDPGLQEGLGANPKWKNLCWLLF